jgi:hypothetical protein
MPRPGHGGGARVGGGHRGGHHGGHHGGHGRHRGWGGGVGPWFGGYPYPASSEIFVEESDLDRKLKELELLERMKRLAASGGGSLKGIDGFEMPSTTTLLLGVAAIGAAYFLLRKKR